MKECVEMVQSQDQPGLKYQHASTNYCPLGRWPRGPDRPGVSRWSDYPLVHIFVTYMCNLYVIVSYYVDGIYDYVCWPLFPDKAQDTIYCNASVFLPIHGPHSCISMRVNVAHNYISVSLCICLSVYVYQTNRPWWAYKWATI